MFVTFVFAFRTNIHFLEKPRSKVWVGSSGWGLSFRLCTHVSTFLLTK